MGNSKRLASWLVLILALVAGAASAGYNTCGSVIVSDQARYCSDGSIAMYHAGSPFSVSSSALNFGNVALNSQSAAKTVNITNTSPYLLFFTSLPLISDGFRNASTQNCWVNGVGSLSPGASCVFTIYFTPTATGSVVGQASFTTAASSTPNLITLSGVGGASTGANTAYNYSGTFTNTTFSRSGTVQLNIKVATDNSISGFMDFSGKPGSDPLCGAGYIFGWRSGNNLTFTFISNDQDAECGFDRGLNFTMTASLDGNSGLAGGYTINNGQGGIFQTNCAAGASCLSLVSSLVGKAVKGRLAAGFNHTVAVGDDGLARSWGSDEYGQLGLGRLMHALNPTLVKGLAGVKQVIGGGFATLALMQDGTLWSLGDNQFGQLGDGVGADRATPKPVRGLSGVATAAVGNFHVLAVKSDGSVWAWGSNDTGQLGVGGTATMSAYPLPVSGLSGVVAVAAGASHSLALRSDGSVWAWGSNAFGQIGVDSVTASATPVRVVGLSGVVAIAAGGAHSLALKADGSVWAWGSNAGGQLGVNSLASSSYPVRVTGVSGGVAVAAGEYYSAMLKADGSVWAWGDNQYGQLGDGATVNRYTPQAVKGVSGDELLCGGGFCFAIQSNGGVWGWGRNSYGQLGDGTSSNRSTPVKLPWQARPKSLAAGYAHAIIANSDGSVSGWGLNNNGQIGGTPAILHSIPAKVAGLTGVTALASDTNHVLALKSDGSVWAWGWNGFGQVGDGTRDYRSAPTRVGGLSNVTAIAAGGEKAIAHSVAVTSDGSVWGWGSNIVGQIGDGSGIDGITPVKLSGLSNIVDVAAGPYHTVAVQSGGYVWAWGAGGLLGDATTTTRPSPVRLTGISNVAMVAAGLYHTLALKSDGSVWGWGANNAGQLGDGSTTNRLYPVQVGGLSGVIAIAAGREFSLALKSDGSIWGWGNNANGQLGDGTTINRLAPVLVSAIGGAVAIAAGQTHAVALMSDGSTLTWGWNGAGQLGNGTLAQRIKPVLAVNESYDGFLDLITGATKNISADLVPPFLLKVENNNQVQATIKYDTAAQGQTGNVYVTAFLKANSPLLANGKLQSFAAADDNVVPVVLTRSGFKQMGTGVATEPLYSGSLTSGNNTFAMYDPSLFDGTRDYGVFCVGYATGVGTPSAKGQMRVAVSGQTTGASQCPPLEVDNVSRYTATSNNRSEALTVAATIAPKSDDIGKNLNVYVWAVAPDGRQFMRTGNDWGDMRDPLGAAFTATMTSSVSVPIVEGLDLRVLAGTQAYVGYGASEKEMRDSGRYGLIYTIK